jgi:alanyl-tRNA synthetase
MYYDVLNKFNGRGLSHEEFLKADEARDIVEIWNDVFMQYEKKDGKVIGKLPKPSVDTGAGLERLAMVIQNVDNIYDTDLLKPIMDKIEENSNSGFIREKRIISDHMRSSIFLIGDGVIPSNTDRGYILRRLLRRAIRYSKTIDLKIKLSDLLDSVNIIYKDRYSEIKSNNIKEEIDKEVERFEKTLEIGLKEFTKGKDAFTLFSSYGFPIELTIELAKEKGIEIDMKKFEEEFKKHQDLSRSGAEQKFKGGLANPNDNTIVRYHTATHLLHQALHDVLGDGIMQKGSNITTERLRFDFSHNGKMTDEEKKKVEDIVNTKIKESLPVNMVIMPKLEAEKTGARHFFGEKYGDEVSIYFIGNTLESAYSKEFCGGPHVKNTKEISGEKGELKFKIAKEEAVAQGIRRIKAVLV